MNPASRRTPDVHRDVVTTEFYDGQGLGNQLWIYAVVRTLAARSGRAFGIQSFERFKGQSFMRLDPGLKIRGSRHKEPTGELPDGIRHYFREEKAYHPLSGADVSRFDPSLLTSSGSLQIDGNFESEQYLEGFRSEISTWFHSRFTVPLDPSLGIISFRGGEYAGVPDLMLPLSYYEAAMEILRSRDGVTDFAVVTDDPIRAREYFPALKIISHRKIGRPSGYGLLALRSWSRGVGRDFSLVQGARSLILSNSSFSWWGAWTNRQVRTVVAPTYWARYNVSDGYWSPGDVLTEGWLWLDRFSQVRESGFFSNPTAEESP